MPDDISQIHYVIFFANGAFTCCGADGEQIPEYQRNLFCDYLRELEARGVLHPDATVQIERLGSVIRPYKQWI